MKIKQFRYLENIPLDTIDADINRFLASADVKQIIDIKVSTPVRHAERFTKDEIEYHYVVIYK